jgi:hypothetical protein
VTAILATASWAPLVQTVVGALIGGVGAIAGGTFSSWFAHQMERQSLAAALASEVQGVMGVVARRQTADRLEQGERFAIDDHPLLVFEATVGKIGFLPAPLASKVVGFYSEARGMAVDFRTLYKGEVPVGFPEEVFRKRLANNIRALEPEAEALVDELRKGAARPWYYQSLFAATSGTSANRPQAA